MPRDTQILPDEDARTAFNWRDGPSYESLRSLAPAGFAWEWLRRNDLYLSAWRRSLGTAEGRTEASAFGLVAMVDPRCSAPIARPIWRADVDRSVLIAEVLDADAPPLEGLDLLAVASLVTLEVDANHDEHVLISDGASAIRIDVVRGTLLGGPALLKYKLWGALRLKAPLLSLRRLVALIVTGRFSVSLFPPERSASRWITELRVADALADGASHRQIAEVLFDDIGAGDGWRGEGESARSRVQRLVRVVRRRRASRGHLEFLRGK